MVLFHQLTIYFHIAVGAVALVLFWAPVIARKGSFKHKRFGRYFAMVMYTVALSGIAMAGSDLVLPLSYHAQGLDLTPAQTEAAVQQVRSSALFLFSLSILVLASTRQGWLAILHRENRQPLRTRLHLTLNAALVVAGLALLMTGIQLERVLFIAFGGFEIFAGAGQLRYSFKQELRPREWWTEHLSGLIGSGIGAYTAFFVFGGSRLLTEVISSSFSDLMILFWIGPGIIGGIAIGILTRRYRRQFSQSVPATGIQAPGTATQAGGN